MKQENKKLRRGITLIEIILAIVLIAIILGVTIPKLMSNSTKSEIKQVITSDVKSIISAATTWRRSAAAAEGTYEALTPNRLNSRLPSNMVVNVTDSGVIMSSGLKTGQAGNEKTGVSYIVAMKTTTGGSDTETARFAIAINTKSGVDNLNWNAKMHQYALDVFEDVMAEVSDNEGALTPTVGGTIGGTMENGTMTASSTDIFACDGTTNANTGIVNVVCYDGIQVN
jgi:type II secretory pathway pseudopilin PulG